MRKTIAVLWAMHGHAYAGSLELADRRLELRARGRTFSAPIEAVRHLAIERGAAARINGLAVLQLRFSDGDVLRVASLQGAGVLHELAAALSAGTIVAGVGSSKSSCTGRSGVSDPTGAHVLGPKDGKAGMLGSMGVRFMLDRDETGGGFSLVEHPIPPGALAAPLHRHSREDEYSFVLEGRIGALLGDEVVYGGARDLIVKPRGQWHTFWNDGSEPARILELISPAGFEGYFDEMIELLQQQPGPPDPRALGAVAARYGLEVDRQSIPHLTEKYGLHFGPSER